MRASPVRSRKRTSSYLAVGFGIFAFFLLMSHPGRAQAGTTTFRGELLDGGTTYCKSSIHDQTCPSGSCSCLVANGNLSGSIGSGYARIEWNENYNTSNTCTPFNASMFAVGDRDIEQVDFTGSLCPTRNPYRYTVEGNYQMVRSAHGLTGSGLK